MPQHRRTSRPTGDGYDAVVRRPSSGDNWIALTEDPLPVGHAHDWAVSPTCGAVVVFSGTVRDHAEGRTGVTHLTYEAYEGRAEEAMAAVAGEARRRWPDLGRIVIWHRTGRLGLGESSVVVVAAAPHRPLAFEAPTGEPTRRRSCRPATSVRGPPDVELLLVGLVVIAAVVLGLVVRARRSGDAVADFRRQIDALSPEARRGVTDRVRRLERDDDPEETTDDGA